MIAYDPFPFTGGTTTVDALWMGVPVLTLCGDRLLSRQSTGILMNIGLDDWVAKSHEEYLHKAIRFARDVDALAHLRRGLRQRLINSPLCDAPRFAAQFEEALRGMWRRHYESTSAKLAS
jgi:predicted O-linked N-acetylglucosamine transferase (SPINDLY family)